jgi:hypothetical protein
VRVVVGMWDESPIGPFADVMWAEPDGTRVLHAGDRAARFVTAVYRFDRVVDGAVDARWDGRTLQVRFSGVELAFVVGRGVPFPPRPAWVTRRVEAPLARRLMGVETFGTSPSGVQEWYRASRFHRVLSATSRGADLGAMAPVTPRCGFGFSEPPATPSLTEVRPLLLDPSGRLDAVLSELACVE